MSNPVKFHIDLDLHERQSQEKINLIQGDLDYQIIISLSEDGIPYTLTDDTIAFLMAVKPDGTRTFDYAEVDTDENVIIFTPPSNQLTAAEGKVRCSLVIHSGAESLVESGAMEIRLPARDNTQIYILGGECFKSSDEIVGKGIVIRDTDGSLMSRTILTRATDSSVILDSAVYIENNALMYPQGRLKGTPNFSIMVGEKSYEYNTILSDDEFAALDYYIATLRDGLNERMTALQNRLIAPNVDLTEDHENDDVMHQSILYVTNKNASNQRQGYGHLGFSDLSYEKLSWQNLAGSVYYALSDKDVASDVTNDGTKVPSNQAVYQALLEKPDNSAVVHKTGDETIIGLKTFDSSKTIFKESSDTTNKLSAFFSFNTDLSNAAVVGLRSDSAHLVTYLTSTGHIRLRKEDSSGSYVGSTRYIFPYDEDREEDQEVVTHTVATTDDVTEAVSAEATLRGNADTTLQNNINAEAESRSSADTLLQRGIDNLSLSKLDDKPDGTEPLIDSETGLVSSVYLPTIISMSQATVTLPAASWDSDNKTITVNVTGVTANNAVTWSPVVASIDTAAAAKVYCSAQGNGTLTFICETIPYYDLNINVVVLS